MRVAVVGGGVIGLCVAYFLRRAGAEVVIVERDLCGQATSAGNAGWITPGLSAPLAAPGVPTQSLKWMLRADSPLLIRPRLDPSFALWSWHFLRSCRRSPYRAGLEATLALNARTLELYDLLARQGVELEMHEDGLLFLGLSESTLEHERAMFDDLATAGYKGKVVALDGDAVRTLEPAVSADVVGGFHSTAERHTRPETLVRGLAERLRADGVEIREHAGVRSLARNGSSWRLSTTSGSVDAERVVLAAGVWTKKLLRPLGARLMLEAAKGYSITATGEGTAPALPLYLLERKVGCSPFDGAVRLAGTLELRGIDLSLNRRRLDALTHAASSYLRDWKPGGPRHEWAGLRPTTPDSLPLIGAVPRQPGVFVATGHGMLGVTLAPATGEALVPLVFEDRVPDVLEPFRLDR